MGGLYLFAVTTFLSAFLLFQVQPLIAKIIVPWFGGSAAVWTTCMLFFQSGLLAGYGYAHWSIARLTATRQATLHTLLLAASLVLLPVGPGAVWKPSGGEVPIIAILLILTATAGLPYVLLSSTSPLLQAWYARTNRQAFPWRLFALSNFASMLALLSYPVAVEPFLPVQAQTSLWSAGYIGFAALCAATAWRSRGASWTVEAAHTPVPDSPVPGIGVRLLWVLLAATASMLMLAVTNHLTQDVASVPFLWVLPLSVYMLSFILAFDTRRWYRRRWFLALLGPALAAMAYLQWHEANTPPIAGVIAIFALSLFAACMVCHGEIVRLRPAPRHLTRFYLMLAAGGAIGGLFVAVLAPALFRGFFELPVALGLCALLGAFVLIARPGETAPRPAPLALLIPVLLSVAALWAFLGYSTRTFLGSYLTARRNFYGSLRVVERSHSPEKSRVLLHGKINHGEQWVEPERRGQLTAYYCESSGIGLAMEAKQGEGPIRAGLVGLGAGTTAAYARPGDEFRFYDINPLVAALAEEYFTYLKDCRGQVKVVLADGRLALEREPDRSFDVLLVDAFSGDSIPVHLLTREALELYFERLKPDGILALHISNTYLDLEPVLARAAKALGKHGILVATNGDPARACLTSVYVLMTASPDVFTRPPFTGAGRPLQTRDAVALWTDQYSNLFRILK